MNQIALDHDEKQIWIIQNTKVSYLYWSNTYGWANYYSADTFSQLEKEQFNLPMDGQWKRDYLSEIA
jgi:hypothetical protein